MVVAFTYYLHGQRYFFIQQNIALEWSIATYLVLDYLNANSSLGTNSSMFENSSSFGDVREVRCSVLGLNIMFEDVRSSVLMFGKHYEHLGVIQHPFFAYFDGQ